MRKNQQKQPNMESYKTITELTVFHNEIEQKQKTILSNLIYRIQDVKMSWVLFYLVNCC